MTGDGGSDANALFLGLISGTSMDGVDAVLVRFGNAAAVATLGAHTERYADGLRARLQHAITPQARLTVHEIASLHIEIGRAFAAAANALLANLGISAGAVQAIGSHGQTLRHHPGPPAPYSWQLGDPATIAVRTGITTVADFRSLDVAFGGEGAPLVPPFHAYCMHAPGDERTVLNLGGIANLTVLDGSAAVPRLGYDSGPGNCLMDEWCHRHLDAPYDAEGRWAASGKVDADLLDALLADPYFALPAPKSTGREAFNLPWLARFLAADRFSSVAAVDVQATLSALTVESVAREIERSAQRPDSAIYVCGGGSHNRHLLDRLRERLPHRPIETTRVLGVDPDFVEAAAFAWLARQRLAGSPVALSTGDDPRRVLLGAIYEARQEPLT